MKQLNTFTANSNSNSAYQSPKTISSKPFFPSNGDSRQEEQQKTAHFIRHGSKEVVSE